MAARRFSFANYCWPSSLPRSGTIPSLMRYSELTARVVPVGTNCLLSVPLMAWLRQRWLRQRCCLPMVIRALDAKAADAEHCCPALLPARVITGQAIRVLGATERAPRIRIRRLRAANLRFAQQRSGNDYKHDDRHARHSFSPYH